MRIGIDVSPLTLQLTGVGAYLKSLLRHMLPQQDKDRLLGLSSGMRAMDHESLEGISAHRHIKIPTRLLYQAWSAFGLPRADRLLGGVDVYHATNYFLPPVARARRVLTIYDLAFLKHPEWCSPKIVGPFARNVPRFAREADAILTCSQATKLDIVECCGVDPEKITVAYGAADASLNPMPRESAAEALRLRYGIEGPFLLFVSTLEPRKNVLNLLRAFERLLSEIPHTLLLVGGQGWQSEALETLLAPLETEGRVRRMGYVPSRDELPAFYGAADLFVFPSLYEGFGLPVIEALACGCPVLTANNSSLPEVGGEAARYVQAESPKSIAEGIQQVLSNAVLQDEMRHKGLEQARRFSWDASARVTLDLYRRLA